MYKTLAIKLNHSNGAEKKLRVRVPVGFAPIDSLVEPLYQICDAALALELSTTPVSCKAGCSVCCHQLIPLSGAEVLYLEGLLASFPRGKRRKISTALRHLREKSQRLIATANDGQQSFHRRYFNQNTACPFLDEGRCGIYAQRPLVCREYHVSSPSIHCKNPYDKPVERVARGLNLGALMCVFSAKILGTDKYPIPMFLVGDWRRKNRYADAGYDAAALLENLLRGIREAVKKNAHFTDFEWRYVGSEVPADRQTIDSLPSNKNTYRIQPARVLEPLALPKLLVRHANALNIKKVVKNLNQMSRHYSQGERIVEIGSGDGYFRYLAGLSGNSEVMEFANRIIETESDNKVIEKNRARGKVLQQVDAKYLTNTFGSAFTPLILSMNVLDIFSASDLDRVLLEIFNVLKPGGFVVHVMSSSVHASVFKNIAEENKGKVLLPYVEGGYLGVVIVERKRWIERAFPLFFQGEVSLARQFQQSPEEYFRVAENLRLMLERRQENYKALLLHDYSLARLVKHLAVKGFTQVYQRVLTSSSTRKADAHHRQLGDCNEIVNYLGALSVNTLATVPRGQVVERSTFAVVVGRKSLNSQMPDGV